MRLLSYVGDNSYFVSIDAQRIKAAEITKSRAVASVESIDPAWKMHPDLAAGVIHPWSIVGDVIDVRSKNGDASRFDIETDVAVYVSFHTDVDLDTEGAEVIRSLGGKTRSLVRSTNMIVAHLPASRLDALASADAVMYIEPPLPSFGEFNAENRILTNVDIVNASPYGLSGDGINVLVYDSGMAMPTHLGFTHPPIISASDETLVADHSTHVAGTIAAGDTGAPGIIGANRGMAPNAQIISYGFEQEGGLSTGYLYTDPGDIEHDYSEAISLFGADMANNSIGTNVASNNFPCFWEGDYNTTSVLIDSIVRGSLGAPFRIVWANGNERGGFARCGAGYRTTPPPSGAKNSISVGSVNSNSDEVSSFSSWGPVDDGRMKPDIVAPGCQLGGDGGVTSLSSLSPNSYTVKCGTSMATPTVTGICALILEDWRANNPSSPDPRNSTFKALLAHTAVDIEEPGPDYKSGYGSVRADAAVDQVRSGRHLEAEVDQSTSFLATVIVEPGDPELKITLAWDDAPGAPLAMSVLVNDLDLVVHSPSGDRAFPWTLGGTADPSALAVRDQENHVDNLEQVFVQNPEPGAWFVEIRGTNIPSGPQPFSLMASPTLINCVDAGIIALNGTTFSCADTLNVTVIDCGPNLSDTAVDTCSILIASTSEAAGEPVVLTETGPDTATFTGSLDSSAIDAPGVLLVTHGDTITATYEDADTGSGSPAVVIANAAVDCDPPVITNVLIRDVRRHEAAINFNTNESATVAIMYGTSCGALTEVELVPDPQSVHSVMLTDLDEETEYFFSIVATDLVGNIINDDNGGQCRSFTTASIPDFFTERFTTGSDLSGTALHLTPSSDFSMYHACATPISVFPTDPAGGSTLAVGDDNPVQITLSGGKAVSLYGRSYTDVWVAPNGYVTLGVSDASHNETPTAHFSVPRVAGVFDDLNPTFAGTVSWKQLDDRAVFTWDNVPQFAMTDNNSFQIELFYDGEIRINWVHIDSGDFLAGLSEGLGIDPDYTQSDLSTKNDCGPYQPVANSFARAAAAGLPYRLTLDAYDDGHPGPLSFTLISLPHEQIRDAGTNAPITTVPYTLAAGGDTIIYTPAQSFTGQDRFDYVADDGGSAPGGGASTPASVTFTVASALDLPFIEKFTSPSFDPVRWPLVRNATIDTIGLDEPSLPFATRFNGFPDGDDSVTTALLDASGFSDLELTYWFEDTGGGDGTEPGDDLYIEFQDIDGRWNELSRHLGSTPSMSAFAERTVSLPDGAAHAQLRIRFVCVGTPGTVIFDDWFIDDISLTGTPPYDGDVDGDGDVDLDDIITMLTELGPSGGPAPAGAVNISSVFRAIKNIGCRQGIRP